MVWAPTLVSLVTLQQGHNTFPNVSQWVDTVKLTGGGAAVAYDLAAARTAMGLGASAPLFVIFGGNADFWCHLHATATVPGSSTSNGTSSSYAPNQRYLQSDVATISLISANDTLVSLQFYRA